MSLPDLAALKREARSKKTRAARLLQLAAMDAELARAVAKSRHTPPEVLGVLAGNADMPVRRAVAVHPTTSVDTLDRLSKDPQWTVLKALVENPNSTPDLIERLSRHRRFSVRQAVAHRLDLTNEQIARLARDEHELVRQAVAYHPSARIELVERLARDPHPEARVGVVFRDPPPSGLHETLACDEHDTVRAQVAQHGHLAFETLERLARDASAVVRRGVAFRAAYYRREPDEQRRALGQSLVFDDDELVREYAAGHATPEMLDRLGDDPSAKVRRFVATRARDPEVLSRLASDEVEEVRRYLVFNEAAPAGALLTLARNPAEASVRLAQHPNCPPEALTLLVENEAFIESYGSYLLDVPAMTDETFVRLAEFLARSAYDFVRRGVALHARTSATLLSVLATDPEPKVAEAARSNLAGRVQDQAGVAVR